MHITLLLSLIRRVQITLDKSFETEIFAPFLSPSLSISAKEHSKSSSENKVLTLFRNSRTTKYRRNKSSCSFQCLENRRYAVTICHIHVLAPPRRFCSTKFDFFFSHSTQCPIRTSLFRFINRFTHISRLSLENHPYAKCAQNSSCMLD